MADELEKEQLTKDGVLYWLDAAIATLSSLVNMIPGKIDDLTLSALKFLRTDETFLTFLDRFEAPPEGAISEPPAALVEGLRRWRDSQGVEMTQGTYMELLGYILQIIRWISERKKQPA